MKQGIVGFEGGDSDGVEVGIPAHSSTLYMHTLLFVVNITILPESEDIGHR